MTIVAIVRCTHAEESEQDFDPWGTAWPSRTPGKRCKAEAKYMQDGAIPVCEKHADRFSTLVELEGSAKFLGRS